ncbi:MAG: MmgE/PrpD family protein, partial [Rhodospirillaceae bacterium]|nr:MmgE/PrpD family protein [Rhodospirillaceae bacterium]
MKYTEILVDFTVDTQFSDIPEEALRVAREATFDCIGVTLAGALEPCGKIGADWARASAGAGVSTVWGHG